MDVTNIMEFIKPELLILIPVLYFIGMAVKQSTIIKDNHIPVMLGLIGIILSLVWVLGTTQAATMQENLTAMFTAITQGVLCAGCSVYFNQIIKQANKHE